MTQLSASIALVIAMVSCAHAEVVPTKSWTLLIQGAYHKGEAPLHPGSGWLALVHKHGRWLLVPAKVTATLAHDEIVDGPNEKTGVNIDASERDSIALIRHPKVKQGVALVPIAIDGNLSRHFDSDKKPWAITFNGSLYTFRIERNKLVLVQGTKKSVLGDLINDSESTTSVAWVGDLDGDGVLDLISVNGSNNYQAHCLFLSSPAASGAAVKQVGCHGGSGC